MLSIRGKLAGKFAGILLPIKLKTISIMENIETTGVEEEEAERRKSREKRRKK